MELNVRQSYHGSGSGVTGVRGELETHLVVGTVQASLLPLCREWRDWRAISEL